MFPPLPPTTNYDEDHADVDDDCDGVMMIKMMMIMLINDQVCRKLYWMQSEGPDICGAERTSVSWNV